MKKNTFLIFLIVTFVDVNAQFHNKMQVGQILHGQLQVVTKLAYEADPTTIANFAIDDDDAGNGNEENIAAESPIIDLSPAFTAG